MKKWQIALIAAGCVVGVILLVIACALIVLHIRTSALKVDISLLTSDENYCKPVAVDGVEPLKQEVSCGYAVIEMLSRYLGQEITEKALYEEYGEVVTSTGQSFCDEMNKRFPGHSTEMRSWLSESELLKAVIDSLKRGMPVPFEWAAKLDGEWTLHYSLIIGADLTGDRITVANPYGYTEQISVREFLDRTSFEAYEGLPFFLKLGFAFGVFEKNTVFIVS